jgi:hypothetical protein
LQYKQSHFKVAVSLDVTPTSFHPSHLQNTKCAFSVYTAVAPIARYIPLYTSHPDIQTNHQQIFEIQTGGLRQQLEKNGHRFKFMNGKQDAQVEEGKTPIQTKTNPA